jgi:adenine-specific DNA-methyltransferase
LYDEAIEPRGVTGLFDSPTNHKSDFCSKVKIAKVFQTLIDRISSQYIVLSYNDEGLLSFDQLRGILVKKGDTTLYKIAYAKFKAQQNVDKKFVCEYVWVVDTHLKTNRFTETA